MSNNYRQWSEMIENLTEQEVSWIEGNWCDNSAFIPEDDYMFEWSICRDGHNDPVALSIISHEGDSIDCVATCVMAFFQEFPDRHDEVFVLRWADTSDGMRVGEFGGGAMIVTAEKVYMMFTDVWVAEKLKEIGKGENIGG